MRWFFVLALKTSVINKMLHTFTKKYSNEDNICFFCFVFTSISILFG